MILLDASVLLAHLAGEPRGEAVTALLGRGGLARPTIQLAEAVDVLGRRGIDPRRSDDAVATLDGDLAAMAREEGIEVVWL